MMVHVLLEAQHGRKNERVTRNIIQKDLNLARFMGAPCYAFASSRSLLSEAQCKRCQYKGSVHHKPEKPSRLMPISLEAFGMITVTQMSLGPYAAC